MDLLQAWQLPASVEPLEGKRRRTSGKSPPRNDCGGENSAVVHDPANLCETSAELFIFRSRALCKVPSCKPLVFGMTHAIGNGIGMISMHQDSQDRPNTSGLH